MDLFSKYAWVIPLKDKRGISIVNVSQKINYKGGSWNMTAVSKNVYFNVLDDIVDKYHNTVHRTIKMKPIDVTSDSYAEYNEDSYVTKPKFKVGDHVRISK